MKLQRGLLVLHHNATGDRPALLTQGSLDGTEDGVLMSVEDLRWLCTVAGPALLNELERGEDA